MFRKDLGKARDKELKSNAGRKPFDAVLMFKILILQSLYNLSDDQLEFQICDRQSFMWFLGLSLDDTVLDSKTIWLLREQLTEVYLVKKLFDRFDTFLRKSGFSARNPGVCVAAQRQQNNSGVSVIDSIDQLVFHRFEFLASIRPKRPCFYRVHLWFSHYHGSPIQPAKNLFIEQ